MATYEDFEDLRDNCPAEIKADIAIDVVHADAARLNAAWTVTADGGFRLSLTQRVSDFWEHEVRERGRDVPDDHFAIEIIVDSYADPEMGHTLYLELHAYCGSEGVGELCWGVFDDDPLERTFAAAMATQIPELLGEHTNADGVTCIVEVTEVAEL
ncbi:MAG: hypothetical protein GY838_16645 [bacterium]|nr:hypothetical protein [bacterium]